MICRLSEQNINYKKIIRGIYKIISPSNNIYIGQSGDINGRLLQYVRYGAPKTQKALLNSLNKYGINNHYFEILKTFPINATQKEVNDNEMKFIKIFKESRKSLNICSGGGGGKLNFKRKSRVKNIIGNKYNRLTVIQFIETKNRRAYWLCKCECGMQKVVYTTDLTRNRVKSCGCLKKEGGKHFKTHGLFREYKNERNIWNTMIQRCTNLNVEKYPSYGGRGITVCERWNKFENFIEDMGKRPSNEHSIERRDNNLGYCKENCSWELRSIQANNTRRNVKIEYGDKIHSVSELSNLLGIKYCTIKRRAKSGKQIDAPLYSGLLGNSNRRLGVKK